MRGRTPQEASRLVVIKQPAPLSWLTRLHRAKRTGSFSDDDKLWARDFATCAVGERRHKLGIMSCLISKEEESLGFEFYHAVIADDLGKAESVYDEIQRLAPRRFATVAARGRAEP